jgi:hypothetical protein
MTSLIGEAEVLKTDTRGRVRMPAQRREALLDEFEKSGMSGAKFARLAGIHYATFANWTQKRKKQRGSGVAAAGPVRLLEAMVEGDGNGYGTPAPEGLLVELPGGGRIHIHSPLQLRLAAELLSMMARGMNEKVPHQC